MNCLEEIFISELIFGIKILVGKRYRQSRAIRIKKNQLTVRIFKKRSLDGFIKNNWNVLFLREQMLKIYLTDRNKPADFRCFFSFLIYLLAIYLKFKVQILKLTKGRTWRSVISVNTFPFPSF